ncbi:hypothetical protein [Actinomadura atramentaria]|uniref:hypothetical protein n=1 Tax=Actinomadura atramentaria TaxID=1990 RepID=UPI00036A5180|nr:hypothetical protein [Actinomadura atramentaria]
MSAPAVRPCPSCGTPRPIRYYLCRSCWYQLAPAARRALSLRDSRAPQRLVELHRQLHQDVPLAEVTL